MKTYRFSHEEDIFLNMLEIHFPCLCSLTDHPPYVAVDNSVMLKEVCRDALDWNDEQFVEATVEMALSLIWPLVKHLFITDTFPSLFDAAIEVLYAAQYVDEDKLTEAGLICRQLVDALNRWEEYCSLLQKSSGNTTELIAAEKADKPYHHDNNK